MPAISLRSLDLSPLLSAGGQANLEFLGEKVAKKVVLNIEQEDVEYFNDIDLKVSLPQKNKISMLQGYADSRTSRRVIY